MDCFNVKRRLTKWKFSMKGNWRACVPEEVHGPGQRKSWEKSVIHVTFQFFQDELEIT